MNFSSCFDLLGLGYLTRDYFRVAVLRDGFKIWICRGLSSSMLTLFLVSFFFWLAWYRSIFSCFSSSRSISTPISDIICSVSKYLYFVHSSIWFFYCSIAPSVPVAVHPTQIMYVLVLLSHCCCLCIPHQYSNVAEYNGLMVFIGSCETDIIH